MDWRLGRCPNPQTFLRPFTADLGISRIAVFFSVYAPTAFLVRLVTRRLPDRVGTRPMILAGLSCLATSMLMYLVVHSEWQLAAPALLQGTAHALLFPSVIAGGSSAFPARYRGLATTLMLAASPGDEPVGIDDNLIVIEDDRVEREQLADLQPAVSPRQEYRQLFVQLRNS